MMKVVRPAISAASAFCTRASVAASSAEGRLVQDQHGRVLDQGARDGEARCRWLPERFDPRSPTTVS